MKKHILLQNLIILFAFSLLSVGFVPHTVTCTLISNDGAVIVEKYSLFALQSGDITVGLPFFLFAMLVCIGSVAFRISSASKPLDWTLGASALGTAAYLLSLFPQQNGTQLHISISVLVLFMIELALTVVYKVGRRLGVLL